MTRRIEFNANSLLKLLVHYLQDHEDQIPLDAELVTAGVSPFLQRYVMLEAKSDKWGDVSINPETREPEYLHVRYEGRKTASWQQGNPDAPVMQWQEAVESPDVV